MRKLIATFAVVMALFGMQAQQADAYWICTEYNYAWYGPDPHNPNAPWGWLPVSCANWTWYT